MMSTQNRTRVIRLNAGQTRKLLRLLDMEYTPSEIAEEIGIGIGVLYALLRVGKITARKAENGHYWIHGLTFATWAREQCSRPQKNAPRAANDFYCVTCKVVVTIKTHPHVRPLRGRNYLSSTCPVCSGKIGKFAKFEEKTT